MEKVSDLTLFLVMELGGPEEFLQIENVKQIINVNQKNILFLFILQMKLEIHKPLCTVESGFKTICCLPTIWTAVCRKIFHIGHCRKRVRCWQPDGWVWLALCPSSCTTNTFMYSKYRTRSDCLQYSSTSSKAVNWKQKITWVPKKQATLLLNALPIKRVVKVQIKLTKSSLCEKLQLLIRGKVPAAVCTELKDKQRSHFYVELFPVSQLEAALLVFRNIGGPYVSKILLNGQPDMDTHTEFHHCFN